MMAALPEFIGQRLKPFYTDLPETWRLWQHKTLNIHRGVIHWDATGQSGSLVDIRDQVRGVVRGHFRPSWWRGFGFGAIVSLARLDDELERVAKLVDVRNNSQGVWQWLVLHFPELKTAVGVRTWTEGYLAPVYQDLIAALEADGYACESSQKDMDAFLRNLFTVQKRLRQVKRAFGGLGGLTEE